MNNSKQDQKDLANELRVICDEIGIPFIGPIKPEGLDYKIIAVRIKESYKHVELLRRLEESEFCHTLVGEMPVVIDDKTPSKTIGWRL